MFLPVESQDKLSRIQIRHSISRKSNLVDLGIVQGVWTKSIWTKSIDLKKTGTKSGYTNRIAYQDKKY